MRKKSVDSGQWSVVRELVASGQWLVASFPFGAFPFSPGVLAGKRRRVDAAAKRAFTLTELLIVITIIGIMAAMSLGALNSVHEQGKEAATKATIAKLNAILMRRYESYMHRRVPVNLSGFSPANAASTRLGAIRDIMWMEMPDHFEDIDGSCFASTSPYNPSPSVASGTATSPALWKLYNQKYQAIPPNTASLPQAKCLYLIVSLGDPEAMEQFTQAEIQVDSDGWAYFVDGWGNAISFLRWAPGFSSQYGLMQSDYGKAAPYVGLGYPGPSQIQSGDGVNDHDPFDTFKVECGQAKVPQTTPPSYQPNAFNLIPLIYSMKGITDASCVTVGEDVTSTYHYKGSPYQTYYDSTSKQNLYIGTPTSGAIAGLITNHYIEAR